jgi:hypothetical protein
MNCLQQRFAIQWYLARPCIISGQDCIISGQDCIISGQDARTTRNFGIFFKLEVSKESQRLKTLRVSKL